MRFKTEDAIMNHTNVWDDLEEFEYQTGSLEELKEDISNDKEGHFTFRKGEGGTSLILCTARCQQLLYFCYNKQ